jgi:hypothetical protein
MTIGASCPWDFILYVPIRIPGIRSFQVEHSSIVESHRRPSSSLLYGSGTGTCLIEGGDVGAAQRLDEGFHVKRRLPSPQ